MRIPQTVRVAALVSMALLLVVLGAALRPLLIRDQPPVAQVFTDTEIGFVHDMVSHHQQALFIVERLDPDADLAVSRFAQQIDDTQRTEIGMMLGWLRLAEITPSSRTPMDWMESDADTEDQDSHDHSMVSVGTQLMPGMATMAELDALTAATRTDAGILFLQLMERHHRGGIVMARAADELLADGPIKQSARDMIATQNQEASLMTLMLDQRGAQLIR